MLGPLRSSNAVVKQREVKSGWPSCRAHGVSGKPKDCREAVRASPRPKVISPARTPEALQNWSYQSD